MCECKKEIEAKLTDRFRSQHPSATNHRAELTGYALGIGKESLSMYLVGCMPIELTATFQQKGSNFQTWKERKTKQSMFFTFCPFCGEKYEVNP